MVRKLLRLVLIALLTMVVQHNASGQIGLFSRQLYSNSGGMRAHDVLALKDSGFLIAGTENSNGLLLNLDSSGVQRWGMSFSSGTTTGLAFDQVVGSSTHNFFVAGDEASWSSSTKHGFVGYLTPLGDSIWWRSLVFDSASVDVSDMAATGNDGVLVVGTLLRASPWVLSSFVVLLDSTGTIVWSNEYKASGQNLLFATVTPLNDGSCFVSGEIDNVSNVAVLMHLSAGGQPQFTKTYSPVSGGSGTKMIGAAALNGKWLGMMEAFGVGSVLMQLDTSGVALSASSIMYDVGSFEYLATPPPFICDSLFGCYWMGSNCGGSQLMHSDTSGTLMYVQYLEVNLYSATLGLDGGVCVVGNGPLCGARKIGPFDDQIGIIKEDVQGNATSCANSNVGQLSPISIATFTQSLQRVTGGITGSVAFTSSPFAPVNVAGCVAWLGGFNEQKRTDVNITYDAQNATVVLSGEPRHLKHIDVVDVTGRTLTSVAVNATAVSLPMNDYPSGVYIFNVLMDDGLCVSRRVMHRK